MITLLGWLWWWVLPIRKRLAIDNFRQAFPDRDPAELRRSTGEILWSYVELLAGKRSAVEGLEHVQPPPSGGDGGGECRGTLCLAGHGASWDMALISTAQHIPITIFVKEPSNRLAAWLIRRVRSSADIELLPPTGSMEAAYEALERGRLVAFVQDQRHNGGIPVQFFGRPARTSAAFASMLWRTRAPVLGAWQWREGGRYRTRLAPLDLDIPEDRDEAIQALTEQSQAYYERMIRTAPHSWLWLHDRWR